MIEVGEAWKLLRKNFFLSAFALFDVQALRMCLRYSSRYRNQSFLFKYYFVSSFEDNLTKIYLFVKHWYIFFIRCFIINLHLQKQRG